MNIAYGMYVALSSVRKLVNCLNCATKGGHYGEIQNVLSWLRGSDNYNGTSSVDLGIMPGLQVAYLGHVRRLDG